MAQNNEKATSLGYKAYRPRRVDFHGITEANGHRLKSYSVLYGDGPLLLETFEQGTKLALGCLPPTDKRAGSPGLGFLICHQGLTGDYVVIGWWARENELPVRVFIRDGQVWRQSQGDESFCVWDIEILWHEREAYVATVLSDHIDDPENEYLTRVLKVEA